MIPEAVIDASIFVKWLVEEPDSAKAELIYDAFAEDRLYLWAPAHLLAEVGNILWKKQIHHGLDPDLAKAGVLLAPEIMIHYLPVAELLLDAYALATSLKRTVYDCLYLALADKLKCPFLTADERLVNAVKAQFPQATLLREWLPA